MTQAILEKKKTRRPLTAEEAAVLAFLKGRLGRVVTRVDIQEAVWPGRPGFDPALVDRLIAAIRAKLQGRVSLQTFYGAGYILIR